MKKDDMVKELVSRIRYNKGQYLHYAEKHMDSGSEYSAELKSWYEGRVSAFNTALMMVDPEHPMVAGQIPNNNGGAFQ